MSPFARPSAAILGHIPDVTRGRVGRLQMVHARIPSTRLPMGIVLVDHDSVRRSAYRQALQRHGCDVVDVARISELERWPAGQVVVTDLATEWWKCVGVSRVILVADTGSNLTAAVADVWVPRDFPAEELIDVVLRLGLVT
jgi:hypothetical protein